ncbi:LytR/AlgR family response regulator transcription factor [Oceanirhabdus sp. W0125-5]|uniref:LytR/AlgR family response regulator transcription factor n=1 Tax=Oceanirhabdus sp. W0125-5 TaxID=2999116 RepID=UPI0022F2FCEE|nr:LytTR family DNA-binding domain-containing protein [Oceanirhabdus sp. W0125-5]WBW98587.1 LytTR family DNA-binding domain-containing protein [Oceanirhabdus sp. W0125-5]
MKIAIVEDEKIHQEYLLSMLEKAAEDEVITLSFNIFESAESFLFAFEDEKFDAILLDIMLNKMNGFSLAEAIREEDGNVPIAFITGEKDYVFDGYKVDACGYILKPIKQENISQLLKKLKEKVSSVEQSITIKTKEGIVNFYESEIDYIESDNHNTNINSSKGVFVSGNKMSQWEKMLSKDKFFKPHRCYIVQFNCIERIDKKNILMKNGIEIPIARAKWGDLMKAYMDYRRKDYK